jgi:hypothetical protein
MLECINYHVKLTILLIVVAGDEIAIVVVVVDAEYQKKVREREFELVMVGRNER